MGTLWIPGAERLTPSAPGGIITSTAPGRSVWHATEANPKTPGVFESMVKVLTGKSAEPHLLYHPLTDRLGQFFPLDLSGRALRNDGTTKTNRVGKVCIQIEVIAYSADPFTGYWTPGPNWRALIAALRSWGIADAQPAGPFPQFIANPPHNVPENDRDRPTWLSKGGHYSHSQIPGNDHGDPGAVSFAAMLAAGNATTAAGQEDDMPYTPEELRAMMQAEIEEYMTRFWVSPTGTGTAIRAQLAAILKGVSESPGALAASIAADVVAKLPTGQVDQATVEAGVRAVLLDAATP